MILNRYKKVLTIHLCVLVEHTRCTRLVKKCRELYFLVAFQVHKAVNLSLDLTVYM